MKNNSPMDQAHAAQQNKIFESPRMVAQRKQRENSFGQSSKETENKTGMPDHLKAGVENLSGLSMDDVRVHYNSPKPAQLLALAYTQGTDIHVGPGQERHLPHEAWHVVQQRQGRVKPTMQMSGEQINDEVGLEREAEVMGGQALQRKGGFRSRSTHPTLAAFQPVQLKNVNLYLPDDFEDLFKNGGKIYMIDASHRGDMYHIRAAWAIEPHPVLIYNYRGENDLVEYLKNTDENITVKTIEWNPATVHENNALINREIITESEATTIIAKEERNVKKTENKMSNVPESEASQITGLILEIFGDKVADGALVMFRDSGRSGVYPELDSGKALEQLAGILRANGLTPITCGNPKNELEIKSIGPYWEKLPKYPNIAKRDVEAYFLKKAYEQKYYKIAVGFRSGALDLFTFMNIPTISISLNELVGEDRHDKLSSWKTRTNIKYEEPRHSETTRSAAKRASVDHPYMSSGKTEEDPGALKALDESILKKGVRIAVAKLREENPYPDYKGGTVSRETMRGLIPKEYKQIGKTVDEEALIRTKLLEHLTTEKDQELGVNAVANLKTTWDEKIHDVMDKRGTAFQQTVYGKIGKIKKKTDKKEELISLLEALLGKEKDSDKDHEKYPDLLEIKKKIEEMLAVAKRALHGLNVAR
ncbi:MAG TPA: DUF4157 domain-containing protein [Thiotrichaceae bacterium]|nr:DUF4157 domain-containing protein [Thiotrichaceae bacterium]